MPTWLSDPPTSLYAILGAAGVLPIFAALFLVSKPPPKRDPKAKKSSTRKVLFISGGGGLALLLALVICDRLFESDREQIVRKLNEMSAGVQERNLNKVFDHVSESFRYASSDKKALRSRAESAQSSGQVTEIPVRDIYIDPVEKDAKTAMIRFQFRVEGTALVQPGPYICKAKFVRDPDGQWRLQSFDVFIPPNERDPFPIPGL